MIDFDTAFDSLLPIKKDGYIEIELPLTIRMAWCSLIVRVIPHKDGSYTVTDDGLLFEECGNHKTEFYYNHFIENAPPPHYGIKLKGNFFYRKYDYDHSPLAALDDFIRFFVKLEEHIDKYGIL